MKITKQARREAKELFRFCTRSGRLDEACVRDTVGRVLQEKPRHFLGIASHLHRLVKLEIQRRTARVESAVDLSPQLRAEVEQSLARTYGTDLRIHYVHNPQLIGGMRVKVGSDVYDGTIQARLAELQQKF